jgi:hypothetical protein
MKNTYNHLTGGRVCRTLSISNTYGRVTRIVCLEGGTVTNTYGNIEILCAPEVEIEVTNTYGSVNVWHRAYVELLAIAQGLDP